MAASALARLPSSSPLPFPDVSSRASLAGTSSGDADGGNRAGVTDGRTASSSSAPSAAPLRYSISFLLSLATSPLSAEKPSDLQGDCVRLDGPLPVSQLIAAAAAALSSSSSSATSASGLSDGAVNGGGRGHRWSIRELDGQKGAAGGHQSRDDERGNGWRGGVGAAASSRRWDGAERERGAGGGAGGSRFGASSSTSSSRYRTDERYGQDAATPAWFNGDAGALISAHDGHWEDSHSNREETEEAEQEKERREEAAPAVPASASPASHDVEASRDLMAKLGIASVVEVVEPPRRAAPQSPPSQASPSFADTRPSWALQAERELAAHRAQWLSQQKEKEELQQRRMERARVEEEETKDEERRLQSAHGGVDQGGAEGHAELARRAALLLQASEVESEFDRFDELLSQKAKQTEERITVAEPAAAAATATRRTQLQAKLNTQLHDEPQSARREAAAWNGSEQQRELIIPQQSATHSTPCNNAPSTVPRVVDPFMGDGVFGAFGGKSLALRFPADSTAEGGGVGPAGRNEDAWGARVGRDGRPAVSREASEHTQGNRAQSTTSAAAAPPRAEQSPWGGGGQSASLWSAPAPPPSSSIASSPAATAGWPTTSYTANGEHFSASMGNSGRPSSSSPASSSRPPALDPRSPSALHQQQPTSNNANHAAYHHTLEGGHKIHPNDLFRMAAQAQLPAAPSGWPSFPSPPSQPMGSSPHSSSPSSAVSSSPSPLPQYGPSTSMSSPHSNDFSAAFPSQPQPGRHAQAAFAAEPSPSASYPAYHPAHSQVSRGPPSSSPPFNFNAATPSAPPSSTPVGDGDGDPLSALVSRSRARKVGALAASIAYPPPPNASPAALGPIAAGASPSTPHSHGFSPNATHNQGSPHSAYAYPTAPSYPYKPTPQSYTSASQPPAPAYPPSMYAASAGSSLASSTYHPASLSSSSPSPPSSTRSHPSLRGDAAAVYSHMPMSASTPAPPFPSAAQSMRSAPPSAAYHASSMQSQQQQQQQQQFAAYLQAQAQSQHQPAAALPYSHAGARPGQQQPSPPFSDYAAPYVAYGYGGIGAMASPYTNAAGEQSNLPPHILLAQAQQPQRRAQ